MDQLRTAFTIGNRRALEARLPRTNDSDLLASGQPANRGGAAAVGDGPAIAGRRLRDLPPGGYDNEPGSLSRLIASLPAAMLLTHDLPIRVRYQETDAMGRLHHANYFTYFELGRTELLRAAGRSYREFEELGLFLVVANIGCQYYQPAEYDDLLTLRTVTKRAKGARIDHEYLLFRGELLLAKGHSTVACVDPQGVVRRLPDWLQVTVPAGS